MFSARRAVWVRSTRSSCQETRAARSIRSSSTVFWGFRSTFQASMRARKASASSPGRTGEAAVMPCFRALNFDRLLPSAVLGPVLFWALRRLIAARSGAVVGAMGASTSGVQRVIVATVRRLGRRAQAIAKRSVYPNDLQTRGASCIKILESHCEPGTRLGDGFSQSLSTGLDEACLIDTIIPDPIISG